jgi:hypothetical protein
MSARSRFRWANAVEEVSEMPLPRLVQSGLSAWRRVAGENRGLELWAKKRYIQHIGSQTRKERGPGWVQWSGQHYAVVSESEDMPEPRRGIVIHGGCDLPSMFQAAPIIRENIRGTVAIAKISSGGGRHRADQLVQTLMEVPEEQTREVRRLLKLEPDYFQPILFKDSFTVHSHPEFGVFPRTVVVLSTGPDLTRSAYVHREQGFLVDPGGWWLNQSMNHVLDDLTAVDWFRSTFKSVGKVSVDGFEESLTRLVKELKSRGSQVMIYNSLVVEPANQTHNYQLIKSSHSTRRRQFQLVLAERSRALDFHIVDIDRILKTEGVREQVDFAHFPIERMAPIGVEAARILAEIEVIG